MPEVVFHFRKFSIYQDRCAMKVGTDGVLLGAWVRTADEQNILDIGTGTGLVALMLAQRSEARIDAIDIDEMSCAQAIENVNASPWSERIQIIHQSLQDYRPSTRYDLIVSNPPYFLQSYAPSNEARNRARHTDAALSYDELLEGALRLLNPAGRFNLILPAREGYLFREKAMQQGLFCNRLTTVHPRTGKPAKRLLMEFSRREAEPEEAQLILHGEGREYSKQYELLTAAYYPKISND
jgi:tRNA1Val (adenine37-N6)-methyltransferase